MKHLYSSLATYNQMANNFERLICRKETKKMFFECEKAYKNDKEIKNTIKIPQDDMLDIIFDFFLRKGQ